MLHRRAFALIGLALLAVVCYLPTLQADFVWDDIIFTKAEPVREFSGLWHIWFEPTSLDPEVHYWPLTYSSFWLEHKLWGFAPAGYHATNIVLHLLNSLLLLLLLRRFALPGAWLAAAIFAVHPVHVEPVAWVMGRKDLLATLFTFTAFLVWLRFVETACAGRPPWRLWSCALLLYVAALFSKSIAITLPVAFLIWHWWRQGRVHRHDVLRLLPFLLVGLIYAVADTVYHYVSMGPLSLEYSFPERLLIACRALVFYVTKLVWPTELAVIYPIWDVGVVDPLGWLYVAGVVAVPAVLWCLRARLGRGPLAAVLFFVVTLSPVLCFVDQTYMQFSLVADRYQYLASASMIALFAFGVHRFCDALQGVRLLLVRAGLAVLLFVMVALTWRQVGVYNNPISLFSHVLALNPEAHGAHGNLAAGLMEAERYEEALAMSLAAIESWPEGPYMYDKAGAVLIALGRLEEAEKILREGTRHKPNHQDTLSLLANSLRLQTRYEEALAMSRVAIERRPKGIYLYHEAGAALNALGRLEEAEAVLREGIRHKPRHWDSLLHLAESLRLQARYEEAVSYYRAAIELDREKENAYIALGATLLELARPAEASVILEQALHFLRSRASPRVRSNILFQLGESYRLRSRYEEAVSHYRAAIALQKAKVDAYIALAKTLLELARPAEARVMLEQALRLNVSPGDRVRLRTLLEETL